MTSTGQSEPRPEMAADGQAAHASTGQPTSRVIACARALGDHPSRTPGFDRSKLDDVERERLAATLGALLRSMRKERRLSTRQLAARSTVARSTITRLEAGERRPRPALLAALAYGLDHEHPEPLAQALQEAAGPSLRPDTPKAIRRRTRRVETARREVRALRIAVGRKACHARISSMSAWQRSVSVLDQLAPAPPTTMAGMRREQAVMNESERLSQQSRRLTYQADHLMGTLAWPYHPLWKEPLERALES